MEKSNQSFEYLIQINKKYIVYLILISLILINIPYLITVEANTDQLKEQFEPEPKTRTRTSTYTAYDLHTIHGGSLAGGVGFGNFDSDSYSEQIFVGGSSEGRTIMLDYNLTSGEFESHFLWRDPDGGLIDTVVDELDANHPGPEILVGGYSGNLTMIRVHSLTKVENETIWQTGTQNNYTQKLNTIFGLAVGDFDQRYPGLEIVIADAKTYFVYVLVNDNNKWVEHKIPLDDLPRKALVGEFDQSFSGNELAVTCVNGSVYRIAQEDGQWHTKLIYRDSNSPMSLVIDDFNASHIGDEIIIAGLSRNATLLWGSGDSWENTTIWRAPGALEGMAYGEFDELHNGKELVIAGYSSTAVMLYETPSGWYNEIIYYDPNPLQTELNGAVVTDFYPGHSGTELSVVGFTGNVTMLLFEPPDFKLGTPSATKTITAGEFTTFRIDLKVFSGYNNSVELSISGLPEMVNYSFSRSTLKPTSSSGPDTHSTVLTIDTDIETLPGNYDIKIIGNGIGDEKENILDLELIIKSLPPKPDFELVVTSYKEIINLSLEQYSIYFDIELDPINGFTGAVKLSIPDEYLNSSDVKSVLSINIIHSTIGVGDLAKVEINVSESYKDSNEFRVPLVGSSSELGLSRSVEIKFKVEYYESIKMDNDDEDSTEIVELILVILLLLVIVIIITFMLLRMRALSRPREKMNAEDREVKTKGAGVKGKRHGGPRTRIK